MIEEGIYQHIQDMFINDMIYRPVEPEYLGCYELIARYEFKRMSKGRIKSNDILVEGKKTFNLVEEHPYHKCMIMSERKHHLIPYISSTNLLPNIADLHHPKNILILRLYI